MSCKSLRPSLAAVLGSTALMLLLGSTLGQPSSADAAEEPSGSGAAGPKVRAAAETDAEKAIREQSIYIPYEKLRTVFEKEGRGVFLPYEKFRELWQAAQEKTRPPAEGRYRRRADIAESRSDAQGLRGVQGHHPGEERSQRVSPSRYECDRACRLADSHIEAVPRGTTE